MTEKPDLSKTVSNDKVLKKHELRPWEYVDDKKKVHVSPDKLVQYFFKKPISLTQQII